MMIPISHLPGEGWVAMDPLTYLVTMIFSVFGVVVLVPFLILATCIFFTPAKTIIGLWVKGQTWLNCYRRDTTMKIKGGELISEHFQRTNDGYYTTLPGTAGICQGKPVLTCYEETGTPMNPLDAAASGLFASVGIPNAEIAILFNLYLHNAEEFNTKITKYDDTKIDFDVYPRGAFSEILKRLPTFLDISNETALLAYMQDLKKRIPEVPDNDPQKHKLFPVFWTKQKGLCCNVIGTVVSFSKMKEFQIYHENPSMVLHTVLNEANRIAEKRRKPLGGALKWILIILIIVGIVGFVVSLLPMIGGIQLPQLFPTGG